MAEEFDLSKVLNPAENMMIQLLIKNKLVTSRQASRVFQTRQEAITLPEEIRKRRLVKPDLLDKIEQHVLAKKKSFPVYEPEVEESEA
ncbi:MAG: hypothetical protein HQL31_10490 [Planctomycetes bacterium]|nr:hypothetical protein [Planctomycetota bacterium]